MMKRPQVQSYNAEANNPETQDLSHLDDLQQQDQYSDQVSDRSNQNLKYSSNANHQTVNQSEGINILKKTDDRSEVDANEVDAATQQNEESKVKPARKENQNRRVLFLAIGTIALTIGAVFGIRWWQFQSTHVSTDNAQIKGHLSPISAKVPATVKQILVDDGDYVNAGQTLLILEDQDLILKVQQAEANLAIAQAGLRSARDTVSVTSQTNPTQVQQAQSNLAAKIAAVSAAQADVKQALAQVATNQAGVAQAQTAVNKTKADLRRYELLYNEGAVPAQQLDTAQAAYENAQAGLVAANKTVAQAQADVNNAQAQLQKAQAEVEAAQGQVTERQVSGQNVTVQKDQQQQAQAQVNQAEAALKLARQQVSYTVIKAPISGYVGQLTAQVGQKVQPEQPLLSVVPLQTDAVYVDANFKETALGKLQIGEKAEVEVDAYPGKTFQATIAGISPATGSSFALIPPDNATGNFNKVVQWVPIRLVFDPGTDPQHRLRPGLSVKVTVDTTTDVAAISRQIH